MLTGDEAKKGHKLLVMFCSRFEHLYGSEKVTPNMHLHITSLIALKTLVQSIVFGVFLLSATMGLLVAIEQTIV